MAIIGNTIKLTGSFVDYDGNVSPATNVAYVISDATGVIETIEVAFPTNNAYETKYIIPSGEGSLTVKLCGIVDGFPEVGVLNIIREQ